MTRVLIVRLSAIGDVIHGLPVLNAVRRAMPEASIGWVVEGRAGDLLRGHSALNEVIGVPRGWLKSPKEVLKLRRKLKEFRPDITLDLQGLTKSAVAAWISGAQRRIGFSGPDGRELSQWLNNERVAPTTTHVIDRTLELLQPLNITPAPAEFNIPETAADAATARRIIESFFGSSRFAIINPGAGWPSKVWPAERFGAVGKYLGLCGIPSLVVWAGPQEKAWAETIVAESSGHTQLAPPTTLTELASVAGKASLFISADTGPLHLAAAVGTPCVGLFGPMPAERNGPYGEAHIAIQEVCLQGSSRERRTADNSSMKAISVERVCEACDEIIHRDNRRRRSA